MILKYYPEELVKKVIDDCQFDDDEESDSDIYDKDSMPTKFVHLFDKRVKDHLNFYVVISVIQNQKIPITVDGNDSISTLEHQIADRLQYKLDFLKDINDLIVKCNPPYPRDGKICDYVQEGHIILVDFECKELWIKAIIVINDADMYGLAKHK